jgi:hypothetical protein
VVVDRIRSTSENIRRTTSVRYCTVRYGTVRYGTADLHSALTPHGGTTYDCTIPSLASLAADLRAYDEVARDTKMVVEFAASDTGGAGISLLYVYYTTDDVLLDPDQVRALAIANSPSPSDAVGGYTVDRRSAGRASAATTGQITTPDLRRWTKFWVYAVCEDGDGNLSREASGKKPQGPDEGQFRVFRSGEPDRLEDLGVRVPRHYQPDYQPPNR